MRERLKRLNRLRESWAQRKKSTEHRIAKIAAAIFAADEEKLYLVSCLDGDMKTLGLFPDLTTRRLLVLGEERAELARKLETARLAQRHDAMNLRRCELFQEHQKDVLQQKDDAASLEATIDVFLRRNS